MVKRPVWFRYLRFKGRDAAAAALACALGIAAAAAIAAALAVEAGSLLPVAVLLNVATLTGFAFMGWRAERASRAASSDAAALAGRLGRLERRLNLPARPALHSTVAEVTGTVGLLGGVVRELARNVAAQNRDVADLKSSLQQPGRGREEDRPALRIAPEPRPAAGHPVAAPFQPAPSLLPLPAERDEMERMRLAAHAFEADRIELHLQPVVALPLRKVRHYEALARLRLPDGALIGPAEFLPPLEGLGRAPDLDRRVLRRALAVARHLVARGSEAAVTVNLSPWSLKEAGFLHSVARLLDGAPETLGRIVLEMPQSCWRGLDAGQRDGVLALRDRGIPLSVDGALDLRLDGRLLAESGVRFVRLPADMMLAAAKREDGLRDCASLLRRNGIMLVAERVEREETVPALIGLGVPLAQGFVFAAPRAVRAEVLSGAAPEPALPRALRAG